MFTGNEEHKISLEDAIKLTRNFRISMSAGSIKAGFFGRNAFSKILAQPDAVGIRIYNAKLDDGSPTFVLVGVNAQGEDLTGGEIAEFGLPCPPYCPGTSDLAE